MEHARNVTVIDGTTPVAVLVPEVDAVEDVTSSTPRTTQGPKRWIDRPFPTMS